MTELNQRSSLLGKIAAYTEILAKDSKSTIFVSLSEAYRKMGMLDDALQVIERGIAIHADFSPAHTVHARILCQQGDYRASEAAFETALRFDPESLAALVGYARLNILSGKEAKARELLLTARMLSPADSVINKLLLSLPAVPESVEDQVEDQVEEPAEEELQPPLASATLAELYLKQGLEPQALDIYRQLSANDPNNLVLRRQIRDLEEQLTESAASADTVEPVLEQEETLPPADEVEAVAAVDEEPPDFTAEEELIATVEVKPDFTGSSDTSRILATFNRWLNSIQQRRSDV